MEKILTLAQHDTNRELSIADRENYYQRRAARAIVTDEDGAVALLYAKTRNYYKLPGGGIDEGEDVPQALAREIMEEIGSTAEVTSEIGQITEWWDEEHMQQTSFCFKAVVRGAKGSSNFTEEEIVDGFEVVWAPSLDEAITLVKTGIASKDTAVAFMARRDAQILGTSRLQ